MNSQILFLVLFFMGGNLLAETVEQDVVINLLSSPAGSIVSIKSTYLATSQDRLCTESVRDGGSWKRVPIRIYGVSAEFVSKGKYTAKALYSGEEVGESSKCEFKRINSHLSVSKKDVKEYNVVDIYDDGEGLGTQTVECEEVNFGPPGTLMVCYGDISLNSENEADIEVVEVK